MLLILAALQAPMPQIALQAKIALQAPMLQIVLPVLTVLQALIHPMPLIARAHQTLPLL